MPTIMWWPGQVAPGTVCDNFSTTMDLLPTFASLAGGKAPTDRKIDGHDITSLILNQRGARTPLRRLLLLLPGATSGRAQRTLETLCPTRWLHPRHPHFKKGEKAGPLLFHLVNDIGSTTNVAKDYPHIVESLMAHAERARADLGDRGRRGAGQRPDRKHEEPHGARDGDELASAGLAGSSLVSSVLFFFAIAMKKLLPPHGHGEGEGSPDRSSLDPFG